MQPAATGTKCRHRDIGPLIGHQLADPEIFLVHGIRWREQPCLHRRMHHLRLAPPRLGDAGGDIVAVGQNNVAAGGASHIPLAQGGRAQWHQQPRGPAALRAILVILIPDIAHGRVAIGDMHRIGPGDDALGRPRLAADDQIIGGEIQLFESARHEWQVFLIMPHRKGQPGNEAGEDAPLLQQGRQPGAVDDMGENIRLGVHLAQMFQHPFAAAHADEPIVDDCHAHAIALFAHAASDRLSAAPKQARTARISSELGALARG